MHLNVDLTYLKYLSPLILIMNEIKPAKKTNKATFSVALSVKSAMWNISNMVPVWFAENYLAQNTDHGVVMEPSEPPKSDADGAEASSRTETNTFVNESNDGWVFFLIAKLLYFSNIFLFKNVLKYLWMFLKLYIFIFNRGLFKKTYKSSFFYLFSIPKICLRFVILKILLRRGSQNPFFCVT